MQKSLSPIQVSLLVFVGIVLVIINMDSMWSKSEDLAHHYALAFRISEHWILPDIDDPTLGEMNVYPRTSHALAAIAGLLFNSTFLGIQLVSLMALAVLWGAVIVILNSFPLRVAYISSTALMGLLAANRIFLKFELHGAELAGNFFFSQLVADSMVVLAIAMAVLMETKKHSQHLIVLFLIVIIFVATGTHLLASLELLGVFFGVVLINNYNLLSKPRHQRLKMHLWYLAATIGAAASVFLNPAFTAMRKISEHNGSLPLRHISNTDELILLCVLVLALSVGLLILWNKNRDNSGYVAVKYLGLYGGSTALLCLLQIALLNFGYGSEYATKKYVFGLYTDLIISIAVLAGLFLKNTIFGKFFDGLSTGESFRSIAVLLTFSGAFIFSIPKKQVLDTSDIVSLERQLIMLRDVAVPNPKDKSNVVFGLKNMPNSINYMFSIAIMKTPRSIAGPVLFQLNHLKELKNYSTILTSVDSKPYYQSSCKLLPYTGSIALVDAACAEEVLIKGNSCGGVFDFTSNGWIDPSILIGFSGAEMEGRWTEGSNAKFTCTVKDKTPRKLKINLTPFLYGAHNIQRLSITIKSTLNDYVFSKTSGTQSIEIALPSYKDGEKMTIDFHIPDAISPKQVGVSKDRRLLGVRIKSRVSKDSRLLGFRINSMSFE